MVWIDVCNPDPEMRALRHQITQIRLLALLLALPGVSTLNGCGGPAPYQAHSQSGVAPMLNTTVALNCLDEGHSPRPESFPLVQKGCDLKLDPFPATWTWVPECDNRLIHLVSSDGQARAVLNLDEQGKFEGSVKVGMSVGQLRTPSGQACSGFYTVTVSGQVNCRSRVWTGTEGLSLRETWVADPDLIHPQCAALRSCGWEGRTELSCL